MLKEYGGLGVPDLRELNLCLLGSWIGRYARDKDNIWKLLIDFKYKTSRPNVLSCNDVEALLENRSIATVKYGCNKVIFVAIHSNSNNVTLIKSGCK
jgi:hypothetical protein